MAFFAWQLSYSQERCATPPMNSSQELRFENWMKSKHAEKAMQFRLEQKQAEIYTLPVVFHIIHNGEDIGVGGNLSDDKIQEQIDILNEDFRMMNPRAGSIPSDFLAVEADIEVEFVIAKQDPNGYPTTGILRKQGAQSSYNFPGHNLYEESYWPTEDYLNIWISQVNYLGWASFPESDEYNDIDESETNRLYDGVVIDADWFGNNDNTGSFESYGQTASHEMGHFLGLHHIWGGGGCSTSDYCIDTPPAINDHAGEGSPCNQILNTCNNDVAQGLDKDYQDMYMNFMDYSHDECMNMFTLDQRTRMRTILENSPRRLSLRTSHGLLPPTGWDLDLAISEIIDVPLITCNTQISPSIYFGNIGNDEITSFKLNYTLEGVSTEITKSNISIPSGDTYSFQVEITDLSVGSNEISWQILDVNGLSDQDASNDLGTSVVEVQTESFMAPFREDFSANTWSSVSPQENEWNDFSINSDSNKRVEAFSNPSEAESWLVSPVFDLSTFKEAGLFFDMSYGVRSGFSDNLEVKISSACSSDFQTIWSAELSDLSFSESSTEWTPDGEDDWLSQFVNLNDYVGNEVVRLAFVFTNNGGNNFYIDNIETTNNSDPDQPMLPLGKFVAYPNPADQFLKFTLSLPETQNIRVQLIDMAGAIVLDSRYEGVLNHTFDISTPNQYGLYFLRIAGNDINQTQRILISR